MQAKEEDIIAFDLKVFEDIAKQPSHEWRVYLAAVEYIRLGIPVLPLAKNSKRLPRKEFNISYTHASTTLKTIDKWFSPDGGKFTGQNIGIATGKEGGFFVLDVDRHGDADGLLALKRLEKKYEVLPIGPVAETPNHGMHHLFRWQDNAGNSSHKIAKGIDTRGGTKTAHKGHIVAFPSVIDTKMYKWTAGGEIPDIPEWVMNALGVLWNSPPDRSIQGDGRGNENVTEEDLEAVIEEEQIDRMLAFINPEDMDYDSWIRVGMSIKSQIPDEDGLAMWDEWSQQGSKYTKGECTTRWKGFSDFGTVRGGTLFYHATQGGWEPDKKKGDTVGNKFDKLVEEMNHTFAIVTVGGKIRILKEKTGYTESMLAHYDLMDKDGFSLLLANKLMNIKDSKGKTKKIPISQIWLAHEGRRTFENGMGLFPDNKVPYGYYNTWNGFAVEPIKGDCSLFINHVKNIICDGKEEHYEWLLDWFADLIQNPAEPKGCCLVMRGDEGCGKGTLANTIGKLFGTHHRHLIDDTHLTSNFNAHMMDAITVFADEITYGGNKKTEGKLKGLVTERSLLGERKGVDSIQYRNMAHLMIASNNQWVIPAGQNSRRWFMVDVSGDRIGDHAYFTEIADEIHNGGLEAILYYLMNRKITSQLNLAPVTEAIIEQRVLTGQQDSILSFWTSRLIRERLLTPDIDAEITTPWPEKVLKSELYDEYEEYCGTKKFLNALSFSVFYKGIKSYGVRTARVRVGPSKVDRAYVSVLPKLEHAKDIIEAKYKGILGEEEDETDNS